ncbi:hypothetical protein [Natrarchaeobius halalkaliphilus]|uniref:hypothetical protein n=1 Tax=Natrarchaeobius halalkaliphilus TaxID=1679091 RepID=UPI000F52900D|nr:hypothetical protein [Natrarchaeobius halalkaliphilus]
MPPTDGNDVGVAKYDSYYDSSPAVGDNYELHLAVTGADDKPGYGHGYYEVPDGNRNRFYVASWWDNQPEIECEDCRCAGCCTWTATGSAVNIYTGITSKNPGGVADFEAYYPNSITQDEREYPITVSVSLGHILGISVGFDTSEGDDVTYDPYDKLEYDMGLYGDQPDSQEESAGFETDIAGDGSAYDDDWVHFDAYTEFDYQIGCTSLVPVSTDEFKFEVPLALTV